MGKVKTFVRRTWRSAKRTSPIWLTVMAGGGVILTAYTSGKDTKRYLEAVAKKGPDGEEAMSKKEKWKLRLKCYSPTILAAATTMGLMTASTKISLAQTGAALTALGVETKLAETLQKKLTEELGEKKAQEIFDKIAQDDIDKKPMEQNKIIVTGFGDVPVRDMVFGYDFFSSVNKIDEVVNVINKNLCSDMEMEASLNEFRMLLGLDPVNGGYNLGWRTETPLEVHYSTCLDANKRPVLTIQYDIYPLIRGYFAPSISIT